MLAAGVCVRRLTWRRKCTEWGLRPALRGRDDRLGEESLGIGEAPELDSDEMEGATQARLKRRLQRSAGTGSTHLGQPLPGA